MGLTGHSPTTIVVVDEQSDTAEYISRVLHDAGQSISVLWANSALRLQKNITADAPCVVIAKSDLAWLPIAKICELSNELNAVVLSLGDESRSQAELTAISHGAFGFINKQQQALLVLQIDRAVQHAQLLYQHRARQQQIDDLNGRCAALLDTANEPIAYTSEGVITGGNQAFASLAGADKPTDLVGRLVSDFIAPKSLYKFSHALRKMIRNEQSHLELDNTDFITTGYRTAKTKLLLQNLLIDGEHSTQVLLRNIEVNNAAATTHDTQAQSTEVDSSNAWEQPLQAEENEQIAIAALNAEQAPLPALTVVPSLANSRQIHFTLKPALEDGQLTSMLGQLAAVEPAEQAPTENSANDDLITQSLAGVLTSNEAELCTQALLNLHADREMVVARIKTGNQLLPISQVLEEPWDINTSRWLFKQLECLAEQSQLVLGPVGRETINATSIDLLRDLPLKRNLVLGVAEQTLSHEYHSSSQFLLQCQKLKIGIALWMDSTPQVLLNLLRELPDSIRSGISTIVLNEAEAPEIDHNLVSGAWAELLSNCEHYKTQLIAPVPDSKQRLQTWWQLGVDWCFTPETDANTAPTYLEATDTATGTRPHH